MLEAIELGLHDSLAIQNHCKLGLMFVITDNLALYIR